MEPTIIRNTPLAMQVCVPEDWTDEQVLEFAGSNNPCGTTYGWAIRKDGEEVLGGGPERAQCTDNKEFVHIILDA